MSGTIAEQATIWHTLRGHGEQVTMFRRAVRRGRWSQAYLFVGSEGIGKQRFARLLAQCLFCRRVEDERLDACGICADCRQMTAGTHPDFLTIGRPEGKNVLPLSLFVGDDDHRGRAGLCYEITLRPMSAARRIAVIDDAHLMSPESANALLKTLEEPPAYSTLILIAPDPDALLPTIRSRCQQVRFAPLPAADVADLLTEQGQVEDRAEAGMIAALSEGSLTMAAQLLEPGLRDLRELLDDQLAAPPSRLSGLALARQLTEGLDKLGSDAPTQRQNAIWLVRFGVEFLRRAVRDLSDPSGPAPPDDVRAFTERLRGGGPDDLDAILTLIDRAAEAESQIQRNQPVGLVLEGLCDDLARQLRTIRKS